MRQCFLVGMYASDLLLFAHVTKPSRRHTGVASLFKILSSICRFFQVSKGAPEWLSVALFSMQNHCTFRGFCLTWFFEYEWIFSATQCLSWSSSNEQTLHTLKFTHFNFEKGRFCFRGNYAKPIFFIVFNSFFSSLSVLPFGTHKKSVNLNAKRAEKKMGWRYYWRKK